MTTLSDENVARPVVDLRIGLRSMTAGELMERLADCAPDMPVRIAVIDEFGVAEYAVVAAGEVELQDPPDGGPGKCCVLEADWPSDGTCL